MPDSSDFPPQVLHPANEHVQPVYGVLSPAHWPRLLVLALIIGGLAGCVVGAVTFFVPLLLIAGLVLVVGLLLRFLVRPGTPQR